MFVNWLKTIPFKVGIGALFVLLVAAVAILGVFAYRYSKQTLQTAGKIRQSYEVLDKAEEIASLFKDMQLESTAFFVDGDSTRKGDYRRARAALGVSVRELSTLVADDAEQAQRVDSLDVLLGRLSVSTDAALRSRDMENASPQSIRERLAVNTGYRTRIRSVLNALRTEERTLRIHREAAHGESVRGFHSTFFQMLAAISLLIAVTFVSVRYNFLRRMRIEADLRSVNSLFTKIFYDSPIAIAITEEKTGKVLNCNKVFSRLVGQPVSQVIGKTEVQLGFFTSEQQRNDTFAHLEARGTSHYTEVFIEPGTGEKLYVSLSIQPIRLYEKACYLTAVLDLTAHKRAEETTRKALAAEVELNKMKTGFVTLASHEFRTPLTTILSSALLLEKYITGAEPDRMLKHIARIRSSVGNLTTILDEFLSITRIEEGKVRPQLEVINFRKFMEDFCADIRLNVKPGQSIECRHEGGVHAATDPELMSNILSSLVTNSIKYSPEGAVIKVSSRVEGNLHVCVEDNGIGIPEEDQKNIFQRFFRASNAGNVQGTGLGLHLLKRYVEMLNGKVRLVSEEGRGTRVEIEFTDAPHAVAEEQETDGVPSGRR